ncbi:hypothetical protein ACWDYH_15245 [Nocardia goodfellowii]
MSERSVEDEIFDEARKFSHAMQAAMRRYAQAANWLERRRARREISLVTRQEAREQAQARQHHLTWTSQAVDRYRAHSQAVRARAEDPNVDHTRRARDAWALREHRDDLAARFIGNDRLTPVEQGVALDGLDAATAYPEFRIGNLFARAHKVTGIEALRYRAQVVREAATQQTRHAERGTPQRTEVAPAQVARTRQLVGSGQDGIGEQLREEHSERLVRPEADQNRYSSVINYWIPGQPRGQERTAHESGTHSSEAAAAEWVADRVRDLRSEQGEPVMVLTEYRSSAPHQPPQFERVFAAYGGRGLVTDEVQQWRTDIGRPVHEHAKHEHNGFEKVRHDTREKAEAIRESIGTDTTRATDTSARPPDPQIDQRLAEMERRIKMLQRGLDAVTADRDNVKRALAGAEGQIEELKNRNLGLAFENSELRARPDVEQVAAQRDRYLRERDEAVRKLAERTPEHERYGSPQRRAEQDKPLGRVVAEHVADAFDPSPQAREAGEQENTAPWRPFNPETATEMPRPNGQRRNGIDRSR